MQVAGRNYLPTNKNTLIRALTEEWDKLPQQLLDNVVQNAEVHEHMSRFGGLSEESPSVFKTRSKLGTHLSTQCSRDERQSRPCAAR
ncbi:hypothetical protein TNCV_150531 [Trichonephila clavipes]|nr:hypothetical protein TNCV_150531 [Trichonephila clavipes]